MIGEVGPGAYLCWESPPGIRVIERIQGKTNSIVRLNLIAGNVYYLRASLRAGWARPRAALGIISEDEGQSLLKFCKPPNDYLKPLTTTK